MLLVCLVHYFQVDEYNSSKFLSLLWDMVLIVCSHYIEENYLSAVAVVTGKVKYFFRVDKFH